MLNKLFKKSLFVETNRGEEYYKNLWQKCRDRLNALRVEPEISKNSISDLVAEATELMNRVPVIWLELQDCAGNSKALLRK